MIAPTTTDERVGKILERGSGFLYLVSRLGVTGTREDVSSSTNELLSRVETELPKAVGFGISTGRQANEVIKAGADAVIVGSAFVRIIEEGQNVNEKLESLARDLKYSILKCQLKLKKVKYRKIRIFIKANILEKTREGEYGFLKVAGKWKDT